MNNKRSFSAMMGGANDIEAPKTHKVTVLDAKDKKWSEIGEVVQEKRAVAIHHEFSYQNKRDEWKEKIYTSTHKHNDSKTFFQGGPDVFTVGKHNVLTSAPREAPPTFPAIFGKMTDITDGAKDAMRVLKGTHNTYGLVSEDKNDRMVGTELAATIGVSEFARGGKGALAAGMINLYRVKHGKLDADGFADWKHGGYSGAGKGGAKRLRSFKGIDDVFKKHEKSLRTIYDTHALKKPDAKRKWELPPMKGASPKKVAEQHFVDWQVHKAKKWLQRG